MTGPALNPMERRVLDSALAGDELKASPGDPLRAWTVRGSLVREILTGTHGELHWKGLRLFGVTLDGDIDLSYCEWRGRLQLTGCSVLGTVDLTYAKAAGAIVLDGSRIRAVNAVNLELTGSLQIRRAVVMQGLRGTGMQLAGVLNLDRSTFATPRDKKNRMAVGLYRAKLEDLYMTRAAFIGGLYANGITVRRNLRLSGVQACSRESLGLDTGPDTVGGAAITLVGADVGGAIYLYSKALATDPPQLEGTLDLRRAKCATLRARVEDLRDLTVSVDHLTYERLHGIDARDWLAVLERSKDVGTQPYRQLASVSEAVGRFTEAQDIRVALQHRIDRDTEQGTWRRLQRTSLRLAIAYGYRPARAVALLVMVSFIAVAVLILFDDFMVPSEADAGSERGFDSTETAATFALDSLVPFARLGVASEWSADPDGFGQSAALVLFVVLKGIAWALAALALAATTGLIRRD